MNFKAYFTKYKWSIIIFSILYAASFILSFILIRGPVTYSGPLGTFIGFCLLQVWQYHRFKKRQQNNRMIK
ncbi:hypothetical protein ACIP9C_00800 [Lysinibacillus sp. NPDC093210]|uniref:hypothetical protein n=1 Tax=Lysinibacillus sp. NPDC093210 TaxID=3364133 RepID=UPI0037F7A0A5